MALDPKILAALSAGSKAAYTDEDVAAWKDKLGQGSSTGGAWNLGQWVIDTLSTGGYATAGLTNKVGQNIAAMQRGEVGGFLDLVNPLSVPGAVVKGVADRRTYSENLKEMGVADAPATWLGLALDIGLDPTTYITGGTLAGVKGAAQVAKATSKLDDSQKIGNLLSGVVSGYNKGKANYKVTVAGNKLDKLTRKQAKATEAVQEAIDISPSFIKTGVAPAPKAVAEKTIAAEAKAVKATTKVEKQKAKVAKLAEKSAAIETPAEITAGLPKVQKAKATESQDEATKAAQKTREDLNAASERVSLLNKLAQTVSKPGIVTAEAKAFDTSKAAFLEKASQFNREQVASLKTATGEIMDLDAKGLTRYATTGIATESKAALYEKLLAADAIIADDAQFLLTALGDARRNVAALASIVADAKAPALLREQATRAFENTKLALQSAEVGTPVNRSWVEGIVSANDAGDAARGMVDWISPELRKSNPIAFKAISGAIEKSLETALKAAGNGSISAEQVQKIVSDFIEKKLADVVGKVTSGDFTKVAAGGNTYADIAEMTADIQGGKLKINADLKRSLSGILGVPANAAAAKFQEALNNLDTGLSALAGSDEVTAVTKGEMQTGDAVLASGNSSGDEVGALVDDAINGNPENLEGAVDVMREGAARELLAILAKADPAVVEAFKYKVTTAIRDFFLPKEIAQIQKFAKANEMKFEDLINEVVAGNVDVIKKFGDYNTEGAIKLYEIGSEGRIDLYTRIMDLRSAGAYKGASETAIAARESQFLRASEELLRSLGIPVRSTESAAAAKLRTGKKKAKPLYSSVTWADIVSMMADKNQAELVHRLRKIRGTAKGSAEYKLGNFLPTQIEGAWLVVKDMIKNGNEVAKGSANFDIALNALNKRVLSNGDQVDAYHIELANKLPKEAAEINKTAEDLIEFVVKNFDELKSLDNAREELIAARIGAGVFPNVVQTFGRMIRFSQQYNKFKADARAAVEAGEAATVVGFNFTEDLGGIAKEARDFLDQLDSGFSDPELAKQMSGMYRSMLLNQKGGATKAAFGDAAQEMNAATKALWQKLNRSVANDQAVTKATKGKKGAEAAKAGVNARRVQKSAETTEDMKVAQATMADDAVSGAEVTSDASLMQSFMVDKAMAAPNGWMQNLAMKFSGSAVMGPMIKTLLSARETRPYSWSHLNSMAISRYKNLYRGKEAQVADAFKLLQNYKSELSASGGELPLAEFLARTGAKVDEQLFNDLDLMMTGLLGDDQIFGLAKANAIMPYELADELAKIGFKGDAIAELKNAESEMVIEEFWHKLEMGDKGPFDAVSGIMFAINKAAANIELGIHFDNFLGKTAAELADMGADMTKYGKLDVQASGLVGRLIGDTDKLFHVDDIKRLSAVERYLDGSEKFSAGSLQNIVEVSDRVTYVLKSTQTLLRPGHWVTSIIGEAAMNAIAGVGLRHYHKSARVLNKFRPGQYDNTGDPFKAAAELNAVKGKRIKEGEFTDAYWLRPDGKRGALTDEVIYELAERFNVLVHGGPGLEDFISSEKGISSKYFGKYHRGISKLATPASYRDNYFRLTHFLHELERIQGAKTLEEAALAAAQEVIRWHPTAGNLSAFEKTYMRRLVYFYTWQRTALTTVIARTLEIPGMATVPSKIQYAIADANGFNPESFGDPWDPSGMYASWYTGQLWGPQFQGPQGEGDAWGFQPAIQPIDVVGQFFKPFTLQPGQSPIDSIAGGTSDLFNSNLNPVLKMLAETSTQSKLGTGGNLPSPSEYLLNQIGVVSTISKISGIGQDPNPYETEQDKSEKDARLLMNLILGQRLTDYNTSGSNYQWTLDQREIAKRLAGNQ